jgi:cellulose synthase/poly-beta-1,6-N-acetylglucosamine synthase-like glycosyltransferase
MERELVMGANVIQGYFGVMNPGDTWLTRLSVLPAALKFKLHHPGKHLLGLSCPLAGNGMCFAADIFRQFGWNAFSMAENWEYYVFLVLNGYRIVSAEDAIIYSQVARNLRAGRTQRMRWFKGRIQTLGKYWWKLFMPRPLRNLAGRLDTLIELAKPSHAMLLFWSALYLLGAVSYWQISGTSSFVTVAFVLVGLQVIYLISGLIVERAPLSTWLSLAMIPFYLSWKVLVTLTALVSLKDKAWTKTQRHSVD